MNSNVTDRWSARVCRSVGLTLGLAVLVVTMAGCSSLGSSSPSATGKSASTTAPAVPTTASTTAPTASTTVPTTASTTVPTPASTTAPTTPVGFTDAKQEWEQGAAAISADQGSYWLQAASDLTGVSDPPGPGYATAVGELRQLASLPDAMMTPAQSAEYQADIGALNGFFSTSGLYD